MAKQKSRIAISDSKGNFKKERTAKRNLWVEALAAVADIVGLGGPIRRKFYDDMGMNEQNIASRYANVSAVINKARQVLTDLSNKYNFEYNDTLSSLPSGVSSIIAQAVKEHQSAAKSKYATNLSKLNDFERRIGDAESAIEAYNSLPTAYKATKEGADMEASANTQLSTVVDDIQSALGTK